MTTTCGARDASRPVPLGDPLLEAAPGRVSSAGPLLGAVIEDVTTLMQQQVHLAKAEVKQSATRASKGVGLMAGAAQGAQFALLFLSIALWWALGVGAGWGLAWSALVVAGLWAVIAAVMALQGRRELAAVGAPNTLATAKKIPDALMGNEGGLQ